MVNHVLAVPAAKSDIALAHFKAQLEFETDCWDTHATLQRSDVGFVLLDVRSISDYKKGHIKGAIHLPHGKIVASKLTSWLPDTVFITYCAGPHCNGATKAAIRLSQLERPVKVMVGGIIGWRDEGLPLVCLTE